MALRVFVVDDGPDVSEMMRKIIDSEPDMRCVGCLNSADRLVEAAREVAPDVVLLDATMPGKPPLEALGELAEALPAVRTLVFSGHNDSAFVDAAVDAGAWGCVSKTEDPETVLRAVRQVAAGKTWVSGSKISG